VKEIQKIMRANPKTSFILQPFALFDRGFIYDNTAVPTDIRLIYLGGELFHSYLRFPKNGDFRCNEHQGGTSAYIKESEIPKNIRTKADLISSSLKTTSLIALDFIVTNNGTPYLVEGNTGPGLSWNINIKKEVYMGKKLIRGIVDRLYTSNFNLNLKKSNSAKLPIWTALPSSLSALLVI
jgi:glutathione synthase/RimK-type ligase-like ATP-grasp enzyme